MHGQEIPIHKRKSYHLLIKMIFVACIVLGLLFLVNNSNGFNLFGKVEDAVVELSSDGSLINIESEWDGCSVVKDAASAKRVIAIGDIHGSYEGLLDDLFAANITSESRVCEWKLQTTPTLLVQMGDMVDRGSGALESLECLRNLQSSAKENNAEVVRLLGNHELWWLTGIFYQRNKADTEDKIVKFLRILWDDILARRIVGSYVHYINEKPVIFVHAGFSDDFVNYLKLQTAEEISNYTNNHLVHSISQCDRLPCKSITADELYEAGPSRGGSGIGGPYWTDFTTLMEEDNLRQLSKTPKVKKSFLQVVGHTMAFCYDPRSPGKHPPDHMAECALGLIRSSPRLRSVCVDGGMYAGARAFLEITTGGRFISYERRGEASKTPWKANDLTLDICGV